MCELTKFTSTGGVELVAVGLVLLAVIVVAAAVYLAKRHLSEDAFAIGSFFVAVATAVVVAVLAFGASYGPREPEQISVARQAGYTNVSASGQNGTFSGKKNGEMVLRTVDSLGGDLYEIAPTDTDCHTYTP